MDSRFLTILGTSSQVPTRDRNHNGYFLKWDTEGILVDPGEGTQRQMTLAGVSPASVTVVLITHFHGDHCLGLPGIVQRLGLIGIEHEVRVVYPASGESYLDCLLNCCSYKTSINMRRLPVSDPGEVLVSSEFSVEAQRLDHPGEVYGYRIQEPDRLTMLPERLEAADITGRAVGELKEKGYLVVGDKEYRVEDFSRVKPGQSAAFVLDTRPCKGALNLAAGVDLLLCEATYLETEKKQASDYGHMTAGQAARLARDSGAAHLVLSHFSSRYKNLDPLLQEARALHGMATVAVDGMIIPLPKRGRDRD